MRATTKDLKPKFNIGENIDGIAAYIQECKVDGIGKKLSHDIARRYGRYTIDAILGKDWRDVAKEVRGVGMMKAYALHTAMMSRFGPEIEKRKREANARAAEIAAFWGSIGLIASLRKRVEEHFGEDAVSIVKGNPYVLTEVDGIGFKRADEIAKNMDITGNDPRRIHGGLHFALSEATVDGHCCLPRHELIRRAAHKDVLDISRDDVAPIVDEAITNVDLVEDMGMVYEPKFCRAEEDVVEMVMNLRLSLRSTSYVDTIVREVVRRSQLFAIPITYNEQQLAAIRMAMTEHVMILTGGPGTGKTTTLKGMLLAMKMMDLSYALCAPTGRAARRMKESTGEYASTIHLLLDYQGSFGRNSANPLTQDVIIVDESSMIDLMLMRALLSAIKEGGRLILIGDNDQLPSVGPGRVLGDMIDSGKIPTVRLTQIFRQQEGSYIIRNAHNIIHGLEPVVQGATDFFFLKATTEEDAQDLVTDLVARRLPKAYPGEEIQVLSPMRKDGVKTGCNELNKRLQAAINPHGEPMKLSEGLLRVDDRVMQTKNNYQLGVFNGDVGVVEGMEYTHREWMSWDGEPHTEYSNLKEMQVRYPDKYFTIGYDEDTARQLDLAYATTIHKSQGSEYDIVVVVIMPSAYIMLQRNLLYTAVTRAKKRCIIVGNWDSVRTAVSAWKTKPRYTELKERIQQWE